MDNAEEWFWDLDRKHAVPASDRGPGDNTLGPYATKGEAENWKATSEQRNESWDDADDAWNDWPDEKDEPATKPD
ncbi:MAG TPA: hypothetical protein VMM60_09940 [Ilumatobacter sp.]|nr:hypothetical protein [Ilumatobacter sp.]